MRYKELPERTDAFLFCPRCHGEFSAWKGDYFWADPESVVRHCGCILMVLVRRVSFLERVA